MKTSVVIADEYASVRQMLGLVLESEGGFEVVGHARTGYEAVQVCRKRKPRLVILDLILPEMNGVEVLRALRPQMPDTRWLIFSGSAATALVCGALKMNPHGFVHKREDLADFREALRAVMKGHCHLTPFATQCRDGENGVAHADDALTDRERQILQMIAEGMTSKQMAERLTVACRTVEHHRSNLMEKLNIHDIARLTRLAVVMGLVPAQF